MQQQHSKSTTVVLVVVVVIVVVVVVVVVEPKPNDEHSQRRCGRRNPTLLIQGVVAVQAAVARYLTATCMRLAAGIGLDRRVEPSRRDALARQLSGDGDFATSNRDNQMPGAPRQPRSTSTRPDEYPEREGPACSRVTLIAQFRLRTDSGDDARIMTFIVDGIV
jgi:hypothetical protein